MTLKDLSRMRNYTFQQAGVGMANHINLGVDKDDT